MPTPKPLPTGGTHAAKSMTPEARSERARKAAQARHAANKPEEAAMTLTMGSTIIVQKLADGRWQAMLSRQRLYAFADDRNTAVDMVIMKGRQHAADQWHAAVRYLDLPKA